MKQEEKQRRAQFFCLCEGEQEKQYLHHLAALLKTDKRCLLLEIKVSNNAQSLTQKAAGIKYDRVILFDHDGQEAAFDKALRVCKAKKAIPAYSNRCFDLWLLLHKADFSRSVTSNSAYQQNLRSTYKLDVNQNIKQTETIQKIMEQITLEDIKAAIRRADNLRKHRLEADGKIIHGFTCYDNPDLQIHIFIKKVFRELDEPI
jgi:hypothetical protein